VGLLADGDLVALDTPGALVAAHGGESRLRVDGDFAAAPDVIGRLDYPAELGEGRLTVRGVPPEAIGAVVETLGAAGVACDSLSWSEPDLEDVYLELAGRAVGEGGDPVTGERERVAGEAPA
jgi:ABC-2 type transport system ATP-binding protein